MSDEQRDRELGMGCRISRRDFLNGVAVGIGALGSAGLTGLASGAEEATHAGHPSVAVSTRPHSPASGAANLALLTLPTLCATARFGRLRGTPKARAKAMT